jgi:hypothetical protein
VWAEEVGGVGDAHDLLPVILDGLEGPNRRERLDRRCVKVVEHRTWPGALPSRLASASESI